MEQKETRRKSKRIALRWKAAVVFDKNDGKPILHTQTHDLSTGGAAVQSEYSDLTGTVVTLLLAQPPKPGESAKMLKIRARVVSSIQEPGTSGYRHGLSFIPTPGDGLDDLVKLLSGVPTTAAADAPPAATAAPAAPAGSSRLERLKQLAQAKLEEVKKAVPPEERCDAASAALQRAYRYLKELTGQLNIVKPPYEGHGYTIAGVSEFDDFVWESSELDFRTKEVSPIKKLWDRVSLQYRLSGGKRLNIMRDYPASEQLRRLLTDSKIKFEMFEKCNDRGAVTQVTFGFPCDVEASVVLSLNWETGKLLLGMRNVEHFGSMEYMLEPEAITDASLDELTAFILGETRRIGPLLLKGA